MEFVIGGLAATSAGVFTNPLEVVKHHMEISKKSQYTNNKYKKFFHTGFSVAKKNGLKSLQKGLSPALGAHLMSYGTKLGTYQFGSNRGFTTDANGKLVVPKSILMSGAGGVLGQYLSNPFYLLKAEHANCNANINEQHGYVETMKKIYKEHGIKGFFRGATASLPRAFIGTSQLTSFALAKENLNKFETFKQHPFLNTVLASAVAGLVLSITMTPFETVLNKMYQQALNPKIKTYNGYMDCIRSIYMKNGVKPFCKGMGPIYLKLGPHTVLCLVFWEEFKGLYNKHSQTNASDDSNVSTVPTTRNFYETIGFVSNVTEAPVDDFHEAEDQFEFAHSKSDLFWN